LLAKIVIIEKITFIAIESISAPLFSFAEYLAACCEDEGEENPP
jgi:hypothetical protein